MFKNSYRTKEPIETLNYIKPLASEFGITRLANITGLDKIGIPVFVAMRPNSRALSLSQGKGTDATSAKVSALMEAIEGYHAETIEADLIECSYNDLIESRKTVVDCLKLPMVLGQNFDPEKTTFWIAGQDMIMGIETYVPYEIVHTDYTLPRKASLNCFIIGSNGLASGNNLLEAQVHGLCEVIERDSYTCWLNSDKKILTKIILETIPCCDDILRKIREANVGIGVWDITSDIGIPAFLVRLVDNEGPPISSVRPASGFGCHPEKAIALNRAITEAAQSRLTFIAGARDDIKPRDFSSHVSEEEHKIWHRSITRESYRKFDVVQSFPFKNIEDMRHLLLDRLRKVGIRNAISVNLTKSYAGIHVARIIVPTLEGAESYKAMKSGERAKSII